MSEPHTFQNTIARKGWETSPCNGGWRLSRRPEEGSIFMSVTPHWLCLSSPLKCANANGHAYANLGEQVRFYRHLLQRNEQMFLAKFGLDSDGDLLLMVEIPHMENSVLHLNWALETLAHYRSKNPLERGRALKAYSHTATVNDESNTEQSSRIAPSISQEMINQYIRGVQDGGWRIKEEIRHLTWHLAYLGPLRAFEAYLTVTRNWTCFQVPTLTEAMASVLAANASTQLLFLEYLLSLNRAWFMARIGVTTDGLVLLLLEVPTETLDFPLFQFLTRTAGSYLDRYGQELNIMAKLEYDNQLVELLTDHR